MAANVLNSRQAVEMSVFVVRAFIKMREQLLKRTEKYDHTRIFDESGEDYLYPESYFVFVKLPRKAHKTVLATA